MLGPENLKIDAITRTGASVTWTGQPKIDKYEVTVSNSQGANSSCFVGKTKTQATCEDLSPCAEYNVSVHAFSNKSGCGEPATLNVTTTPGRKFIDYIFLQLDWAAITNLWVGNSLVNF